jgi:hypothetical protein
VLVRLNTRDEFELAHRFLRARPKTFTAITR